VNTVILLLLSFSLYAAVIEAPQIDLSFQQNPSGLSWRQIKTDHFEIIFSHDVENEAKRVAHILEKAYPFVARSLKEKPPRIPIVLQSQSLISNGFVTLAPRRSELFLTPATDPVISNTDWLKTLAIHEFRHVVQFEKGRRGFNKALRIILGQVGQSIGLALTLPPWFFEGDAVGIETALTRGGRGRLPLFDRDLRTIMLSGKKWDYDKAHLGSYDDYVPDHYLYGYFYTSFLRNKYGDLFLSDLANESAKRSYFPLSFYWAYDRLTGESFEKFYSSVMSDLVTEWSKRADKLSITELEVTPLPKHFGWTNYLYPQATKSGKIFALKKGLSFIEEFVLLNENEEESVYYPASLHSDHPFKVRDDKVAFFELDLDPRWGYRDYSRLKVLDIQKKEMILDLRGLKGRYVVLSHDGKKLAYIEWNERQEQAIIIMDISGNILTRTPVPKESVITSIDWKNDDELVVVVKDYFEFKWIADFRPTQGLGKVLFSKSFQNIGHVAVEGGEIFFEGPASGIDNLYHLSGNRAKQLTVSKFGAYAPDLSGTSLIYNDYSFEGMRIVRKKKNWQDEETSSDSFYPVFEKFSNSEGLYEFESQLSSLPEEQKITDYSQMAHAINVHSWLLLAPPLSSTITASLMSRDILNNLNLSAGALYDLNEQVLQGFTALSFSHYYPVFDAMAAYGERKQNVTTNGIDRQNKWQEGSFEAGLSIPWQYLQGRFRHSFTSRAFSKIIKVTNKISIDETEVRDGALFSPGIELSYSIFSRMAKRDLNPTLGLSIDGRFEEGRDITGDNLRGRLFSTDGRLFLPGLWYHHSFYHQIAFESQDDKTYQYSSRIFYPRGTKGVFLSELRKYSGNYTLPLFYPDWHWSRYLYLKRMSLNVFYDQLSGRIGTLNYMAATTGWETIFEMHLLRLNLPINLGVRGSYIIDGIPKDDNYEIFLATNMAQF
jgi:hypothetical protein